MPVTLAHPDYRHDLGDGLVLRWSTAADTERIAQLLSMVFRRKEDDPPDPRVIDAVRRTMRGDHPLLCPGDYALVENTREPGSPAVACTCLQRQEWVYEGIPFAIGRPEPVATDPNYRKRGLIRALFELLHARSEAEGHLAQGITGIPYFYRQFGYEYALDLGGRRTVYLSLIPKAKEGEPEPYTLRVATTEDIPHLMALSEQRHATGIVWTRIPERYWRYQIELQQDPAIREAGEDIPVIMIVDVAGVACGCAVLGSWRRGSDVPVYVLELALGTNWQAAMPPLLRAFQAYGERMPVINPEAGPPREISLMLGRTHPAYDALGQELAPLYQPPYAWYVRVPDLPAFIRHIAPALERRLAGSILAGHTGELKLNLYRGGLRLAFAAGRLAEVEPWHAPAFGGTGGDAGFPPLVFLQLLFGHRSLDELRHAFPDVWASNEAEPLLKAVFPARPSWVASL